MGVAESIAGHFDTFKVNGTVATVATVASITAMAGDVDARDNNSEALNDFYLDFQALHKTVSDLIRKLTDNGLLQ